MEMAAKMTAAQEYYGFSAYLLDHLVYFYDRKNLQLSSLKKFLLN